MTRDEYRHRLDALLAGYPSLFAGAHLGHDIAPGWISIVQELCGQIDQALADAEKRLVRFEQIKEKFGGLRAYLNVAPLRIDMIGERGLASGYMRNGATPGTFSRLSPFVRAAEEKSYRTCMFCGAPGRLRPDRDWVLTLCDKHEPFSRRDLDSAFDELTTP